MPTPQTPTSPVTAAELDAALERYALLRDSKLSIEEEMDALCTTIKRGIADGHAPKSELYRAELRASRTVDYPLDRFREVFGDAATLEACCIDRKKADALAKAGDLDGEQLKALATYRERTPGLYLVPLQSGTP